MSGKNSFSDLIRSLNGKILGNDLEDINEEISLESQQDLFTEDVLLIEFGNNLLLDVSWREPLRHRGNFVVRVIHGCDWENPLLKIKSYSFKSLRRAIIKAHTFVLGAKDIKRPLYCPHEPHD